MAMVMSMTNKHEKFSKPESFFLMAPGDCTNDVLGHATATFFLTERMKAEAGVRCLPGRGHGSECI